MMYLIPGQKIMVVKKLSEQVRSSEIGGDEGSWEGLRKGLVQYFRYVQKADTVARNVGQFVCRTVVFLPLVFMHIFNMYIKLKENPRQRRWHIEKKKMR